MSHYRLLATGCQSPGCNALKDMCRNCTAWDRNPFNDDERIMYSVQFDQAQLLALPVVEQRRTTEKRIKRLECSKNRAQCGEEWKFLPQWRSHPSDILHPMQIKWSRATTKRNARFYRKVKSARKQPELSTMEVQARKLTPWEREKLLAQRLSELNRPRPPPPPPAPELPAFPDVPVALKDRIANGVKKFVSYSGNGSGRAKSLLGKYISLSRIDDHIADHLETVWIFTYHMLTATTYAGRMLAIATLAKILRSKMNVTYITIATLQSVVEHFLASKKGKKKKAQVQAFESFSLDGLECGLEFYNRFKESPIYKKMYRLMMYLLSMSVFAKFGLTFDALKFEPCAEAAIKAKYHLGPDFVVTMLDTLVFMCKRGYQCYVTGSVEPIFHSSLQYQEWFDEAERLNRQSQFLSNAQAHSIDKFAFLADLRGAIEKGRSIKKYVSNRGDMQMISKLLSKLEYNYDMEVTKRASQKARAAPYALLIHGGSSVGKTSFVEMCFKHFGKVAGLRTSSDHKYTRNPGAAFWDGYDTSKWCVVLDDIAYMSPSLGIMDPSLQELLWIVNNTPYVPNQAAIEDKGRTPLMCEFVMGTSNTMNLNTTAYFACPLAVQRRFPYVINLKPKAQYQDPDRPGMLASHLRPPTTTDTYDDLWDIVLYKVVPVGGPGPIEMARNERVETFCSIVDFLKWFNKQIHEHERIQSIVKESLDNAEDVKLCDGCELPRGFCECEDEFMDTQAGEDGDSDEEPVPDLVYEELPAWMDESLDTLEVPDDEEIYYPSFLESCGLDVWCTLVYYKLMYQYVYSTWYLNPLAEWWWGKNWFWRQIYASPMKTRVIREVFGYMGKKVQDKIGYPAILASALTAVGVLYAAYKAGKLLIGSPQGAEFSVSTYGSAPIEDKVVKPYVSYTSPLAINRDDFSQTTLASKGQDPGVLRRYVQKATVAVRVMQEGVTKHSTMVNVRGNVYMLNHHGIFPTAPFTMEIIDEATSLNTGISHVFITESMLHRVPERDLVFVRIAIRPPGSDLTEWFCKRGYQGKIDGEYVGRHINGKAWSEIVRSIEPGVTTWKSLDRAVTTDVWKGRVACPTQIGDCGTCLISHTPAGHIILGVHVLGRDNSVGAIKVDSELVKSACDTLEPTYCNRGSVVISAPSQERVLGPLSPQSATWAVNGGSGNVMGSILGFRASPRTNVGSTLIRPFMENAGYATDKVAPTFSRQPWILALKDMTRPVTLMRDDVLQRASCMFISETQIPVDDVRVYSLHVALNGKAGVRYCDKLNRKTSAGFPYKCPKTRFLYALDDGTTDVGIIDEIKNEMSRMVEIYHSGQRANPIYCGHPKDEPLSQEKADLGKIRIFTASGMAHTLIVRMYLLSVIVHMQNNRFVYETGPGTVVQSLEWTEIYSYLTKFGSDRIVAGDYSKFDKRMPASVILETFKIIYRICERAGYTEDDLRVVKGIGYDTAFPIVDFNGDLIEFYGSNPSGHPLTVIVNGLANALYLRYCYIILRPPHVIDTFKQNVNLLTYGDDNIMGVSQSADWFNHTAIQRVLGDIDIGYTMADKEAQSVPFISIASASFLKRTWRYDQDICAWVAPLDSTSIAKMLLVCVKKDNISEEAHAIEVLNTAVREYFWYGRSLFEEKKALFLRAVAHYELSPYYVGHEFPTWDQLLDQFRKNSEHIYDQVDGVARPQKLDFGA